MPPALFLALSLALLLINSNNNNNNNNTDTYIHTYIHFKDNHLTNIFTFHFTHLQNFSGMKNFVCLYGVVYGVSCLLKMVNNWFIIIIARILSGVGTSLLFSVLESWMVKVHKKRGFPENALVKTFSEATFVNGVTAVVAGAAASMFSDDWGFNLGYRAPFALAAVDLFLMTAFVWVMWPSDRQEQAGGLPSPQSAAAVTFASVKSTLSAGFNDMLADKRIFYLCVVQSLFEGAMSVFVFVWTPTLMGGCSGDKFKFASLGWIFASFMVAIIVGSQAFEYLTSTNRSLDTIARVNLGAAAVSMLVACIAAAAAASSKECIEYASTTALAYVGFAAFEICCGMYFPAIATLKSIYLPERSRASLMNFARIGLNAILIVVLVLAGTLSNSVILFICTTLLLSACAVQVFKLPAASTIQATL